MRWYGEKGEAKARSSIKFCPYAGARVRARPGLSTRSNLNFADSNKFLDPLLKNGLLEAGLERASPYKTTQRGIEVLEHFQQS